MKKFLVVLTLIVFSCMFCFAEEGTQDTTSFNVTATKSGSLSSDYALVVTASVPEAFVQEGQSVIGEVGSVESFDITQTFVEKVKANFSDSTTINSALTLNVSTNSKKPVLVDVWFSAFRDTTRYKEGESQQLEFDGIAESFLKVRWTAKSSDPSYTSAIFNGTEYKYRLNLTANNTALGSKTYSTTATNAAGQTMNLVFTPVEKNGNIPEIEAPTLPGFDPSPSEGPLVLISRTVNFDMALDSANNFNLIPANTNYTCTVRITVKGD
ncbi:MAG: hypothetical protein J6P81_08085 [Spirochaetales bacterium]|nr:hypothetical protein [Spirochaetales bacterium]MBO6049141.1 hypothetical protein [Spirochaetales bacterium]MBO7349503.1 hypothetical protein [Spirochaetales bacterium]